MGFRNVLRGVIGRAFEKKPNPHRKKKHPRDFRGPEGHLKRARWQILEVIEKDCKLWVPWVHFPLPARTTLGEEGALRSGHRAPPGSGLRHGSWLHWWGVQFAPGEGAFAVAARPPVQPHPSCDPVGTATPLDPRPPGPATPAATRGTFLTGPVGAVVFAAVPFPPAGLPAGRARGFSTHPGPAHHSRVARSQPAAGARALPFGVAGHPAGTVSMKPASPVRVSSTPTFLIRPPNNSMAAAFT